MINEELPCARFEVKMWYANYLKALRTSVLEGNVPIHQALKNPAALDAAVRLAYECTSCRKTAVVNLAELTKEQVDTFLSCASAFLFEFNIS